MHAHKLLDTLKGREDGYSRFIPNLPRQLHGPFHAWMDRMAETIADAHCFSFANVPVDRDGRDGIDLPGVTEDERAMFNEGLLPLPFETCWFEIDAPAGETFSYLIQETDAGYRATPFRLVTRLDAAMFAGESWLVSRCPDGIPNINVDDQFGGAHLMAQHCAELGFTVKSEQAIRGEVGMINYLLVMLNSKTTQITRYEAPAKLNKARAKKGRAPLPEHRVVTIVPNRIASDIRREYGDSAGPLRNSPRLHWRRSHIRTLPGGDKIPIFRMLIGYKAADGRELVPADYHVKL